MGTGDDDLVGLRAEALFDCRDDGGEKGIVEVGNDDRNNLGLSRAQHRGARIGAIVERLHCGFDLLDELGADALPASQNVRDGSRRNASHPRHIIDRIRFSDHCRGDFPRKTIFCKSFYFDLGRFQVKNRSRRKKIGHAGSARLLEVGSFRFGRTLRLPGNPFTPASWRLSAVWSKVAIRPTATSTAAIHNVRFTCAP